MGGTDMRIAIVEDDPAVQEQLRQYIRRYYENDE